MTADRRDFDVVLVLSGGNALGAFEAGLYEALHDNGLEPDWVIGASIGAINAALIAGSAPERRMDRLRAFWRPTISSVAGAAMPWLETGRRTNAVTWTTMTGRPGIFGPLLSALWPWTDIRPSLFETNQLETTLAAMVDFDLLNDGPCRFTATAVDVQTGEDVVFDSATMRIGPAHIRASAALPVVFPPVEVDGGWLVDGGLSANLPLDPVLAASPRRPTLCIAVDLPPLTGAVPATLGEAAGRMQDLIFAAQSRRTIARWQAAYAGRDDVQVTLLRLSYSDQQDEVAGKALDFSGPTVAQRWFSGHHAGNAVAAGLATGSFGFDEAGLSVRTVSPDALDAG